MADKRSPTIRAYQHLANWLDLSCTCGLLGTGTMVLYTLYRTRSLNPSVMGNNNFLLQPCRVRGNYLGLNTSLVFMLGYNLSPF